MATALELLERDLGRDVGRCITDFGLIERGDRVMVCLSGGKDSYTLLHLLERTRRRAPVPFELVPVHLDQGHPGYDGSPLTRWCNEHGFELRVLREDTHAIVTSRIPEGKTFCSLCSRLRRGILYNAAEELGCTKIALGHHADDAIETLLMNLFFAGSIGAMPPKLVTRDGRNTVIRPLLYIQERRIAAFAAEMKFPILPCDLCGSQENLQRKQTKQLIADLETRIPQVRDSLLAALSHVKTTHLFDEGLRAALGATVAHESAAHESANHETRARDDVPMAAGGQAKSEASPAGTRHLPVL